uniref:Small ribosomal subunit protein uS14c n=1 Tax=Mesostigma viride TaxID=41882 RepID=RR14_MESVI|nr:ribosomal protein S14 [Mesostigma viride]Q9MUR6.1 RecName: Full=Small ribosomal subunit protein uS14c; AltName: Full=30S ribosomal protein S14, chloroplastic [Mesostigma viride]AAF43835.1 ribosomal protein S14 [Mesostigma viride]WKT08266.1 ribosomal protein S14 [Mesostigma viride]
MAKKSMIEREKKRQKLVNKYAVKRKELKEQIKTSVSFEERFKLQLELQKLPRNSSPTRLHNRCSVTGRPKGYYRDFGLSRHVLREMAHECLLPGVTKSSW